MKRIIATLCATVALSGCSATGRFDNLQNRVACTVAKDKAFVVSEYGPIGITGEIAEADRAVICK